MWKLNETHYAALEQLSRTKERWEGSVPRRWAYYATGMNFERLSCKALTRSEVIECAAGDSGYSPAEVFLTVMAWGGMNAVFGRSAWRHIDHWSQMIIRLREGRCTRASAYDEFAKLLARLTNPGMGPSHFTKLIYFSSPAHDGYILNKWGARSINMLFEATDGSACRPVKLTGDRVSVANGAHDYERYCRLIELLADQMGEPNVCKVQQWLICNRQRGSRTPEPWRQYLMRHDTRPALAKMPAPQPRTLIAG